MTKRLAFVISRIFGPESTVSLGIWALMSFATDLVWRSSLLFIMVMFVINVTSPMVVYILFYLTGRISDIEVTDRRQRPPVLITIQAIFTLGLVLAFRWGTSFYFSIAVWIYISLLLATIISFFWKISLHMVGNTMFFVLAVQLIGLPVVAGIVALSIVAWSRLVLKKHTVMQLVGGVALPAVLFLVLR